jgi:N-methylhydantoinase A
MSVRIGVDIGGTFTDISVVTEDGGVRLWKEDSTADRPEDAIQRGLRSIAAEMGYELDDFLAEAELVVHGSTIGTNTVIERNGPTVGLICTGGFRDALLFRDGFKWDRFNSRLPRPEDFVDRFLRVGVEERIAADGSIVTALDEASVRAAARTLRAGGAESIAVALLWSSANGDHERRVREIVRDELDEDVPILLSSEILPEIGEWVRTSAAVLSAYVYPRGARYLRALDSWLTDHGLSRNVLIMHVNGGCASVDRTLELPVSIINSGPAAAPAAARHVSRRVGAEDVITADMGGTSFDVCVIKGNQTPLSRQIQVEHQPIGVQGVEVHSVGAGGGSIAWIDSGGALRVGPQSAGAVPGPVAYAKGGELPTVTDANVVLGYLSPQAFLGGRRELAADLSRQALEKHIGEPLGHDAIAAAAGVIDVVNANMVDAIRVVSVQRGIDPRPFLLVAGGGAGPLHAGRLAEELGIAKMLIPAEAGTICSFGMTVTDVRHDYSSLLFMSSTDLDVEAIRDAIGELEERAHEELTSSGFGPADVAIGRSVDARYKGQVHELTIPVSSGEIDEAALTAIAEAFHAAHADRYTWSMKDHPVEYLHWRVTGTGAIEKIPTTDFSRIAEASPASASTGARQAYFRELGGMVEVPAYEQARLEPGATIVGPAIIDAATTTVVLCPGHRLTADGLGSMLVEVPSRLAEPGGELSR